MELVAMIRAITRKSPVIRFMRIPPEVLVHHDSIVTRRPTGTMVGDPIPLLGADPGSLKTNWLPGTISTGGVTQALRTKGGTDICCHFSLDHLRAHLYSSGIAPDPEMPQ
jgi:hypothetical protein